ncbi:hypothetical protein [Sphingomonas arenae]|uniref:hypothetical protein n=1 Tax=Sphingomonas arenae TaxID=2812555 RepID=UPI00196758BF|nr:hypothetical protein [Sphingomonas arenae]
MIRAKLILAAAAVAATSAASASTPEAWAQLDRQVTRACLNAAGLTRARIIPDKASFSDRVPVELRIVEGYNRGGVVDVKLCAYDRRTRRATTVEGVGRLGVNRR